MHWRKPQILLLSLRFFLYILILASFASTAFAQGFYGPDFPPLKLELNDPSALLLDPGAEKIEDNKAAMINVYYENCVAANSSADFEDTMKRQCACTAAEMDKVMDAKQLRTMFRDTKTGDFEYARMMLLAYLPCMRDTIAM